MLVIDVCSVTWVFWLCRFTKLSKIAIAIIKVNDKFRAKILLLASLIISALTSLNINYSPISLLAVY